MGATNQPTDQPTKPPGSHPNRPHTALDPNKPRHSTASTGIYPNGPTTASQPTTPYAPSKPTGIHPNGPTTWMNRPLRPNQPRHITKPTNHPNQPTSFSFFLLLSLDPLFEDFGEIVGEFVGFSQRSYESHVESSFFLLQLFDVLLLRLQFLFDVLDLILDANCD